MKLDKSKRIRKQNPKTQTRGGLLVDFSMHRIYYQLIVPAGLYIRGRWIRSAILFCKLIAHICSIGLHLSGGLLTD